MAARLRAYDALLSRVVDEGLGRVNAIAEKDARDDWGAVVRRFDFTMLSYSCVDPLTRTFLTYARSKVGAPGVLPYVGLWRVGHDGSLTKLFEPRDPAPFQKPPPVTADKKLNVQLKSIGPHFEEARKLFHTIFRFFVSEYSDGNITLGPTKTVDVPTEIDGHDGHYIIHPDYAETGGGRSGRLAHNNHFHAQLGLTHYTSSRRR